MKRILLALSMAALFCTAGLAFENFKEAYESGMAKTEGFGNFKEAREDFDKALSLAKKPAEKAQAVFQTGETFYLEGDTEQARKEYARIMKMEKVTAPYIAQAQLRIADTFAVDKNYQQARQEYLKVLAMPGKIGNTRERRYGSVPRLEAQYKIGEMYRTEGHYEKAKEEFRKIMEMEEASDDDKLEAKYRIISIYR